MTLADNAKVRAFLTAWRKPGAYKPGLVNNLSRALNKHRISVEAVSTIYQEISNG